MSIESQAAADSAAREALRVAYQEGYTRSDLHELVDDIVQEFIEATAAQLYGKETDGAH